MKNAGTVALVIRYNPEGPVLVEALSDDQEIHSLEEGIQKGDGDPLSFIYDLRAKRVQEDEEFGDYVEELLTRPFISTEIQAHGIQWLKSKIRIEEYQKSEGEATKVIATYAYKIFTENPDKTDFLLAGPQATVRIRVFEIDKNKAHGIENDSSSSKAA